MVNNGTILPDIYYNKRMNKRLSSEKRALGIWIRAWQLAGGQWPPESRGIAHQIVMMLAHALQEASNSELSEEEVFVLARETFIPLMAQKFYSGSEQDIAIERIQQALLDVEFGDL